MEILHLVSSGQLGGTEASVLEMIGSVRAAYPAWQVRVVVPESGAFVRRLRQNGIAVDVLPFPARLARLGETGRAGSGAGRALLAAEIAATGPSVLAYARRLKAAIGTTQVIHAHGFKMQVLAAMVRPAGARLLWHLHDYVSTRPAGGRLLRTLAGRCSAAIANSHSVASDASRVLGDSTRIETVLNAVDLDCFHPTGDTLDLDRLGGAAPASTGTVRAGLVATFGRWKGHATFFDALSRLPARVPVRGYVIGGPSYRTVGSQHSEAELRAIASHFNLGDRLVFTGPCSDPASAMRALDIVVHASTQPEPFGMVIAEAMACGCAVVISRAGGAAELVVDDVDGWTHEPGDAAGLAQVLERAAGVPADRVRIGAAARCTAQRRFDRARLARELAPIYTGAAA